MIKNCENRETCSMNNENSKIDSAYSLVPSFHGYYMKGGALEVGKASTTSFIWTCVTIIIFNFLITQMLLG